MSKQARPKFKEGEKAQTQAATNTEAKELCQPADHDYAMEVSIASKRKESEPTTPSKIPVGKKSKPALREGEISNLAILEAIQNMEKNFNEQLLDLREQFRQSNCMIASLAKAVQYNADEVKDCKEKINDLEKCNERLCKENNELKERIREQERYKMRWCLKIKGLREEKDESTGSNVIQIFNKIAPDMEERQLDEAIDVAHRVGRKDDNRKRHIVVLFVRRHVKEELWRRCKDSPVCREKGIRLAEMLPLEDREARKQLWPQIEQARREGKRAYFRGPHAYIEGRRIG